MTRREGNRIAVIITINFASQNLSVVSVEALTLIDLHCYNDPKFHCANVGSV